MDSLSTGNHTFPKLRSDNSKSCVSIVSKAETFYSAHTEFGVIEDFKHNTYMIVSNSDIRPADTTTLKPMIRSDSGYAEIIQNDDRRSSTTARTSSSRLSRRHHKSHSQTRTSRDDNNKRPGSKRATKSSPSIYPAGVRPTLQNRYSISSRKSAPRPSVDHVYQFPDLIDAVSQTSRSPPISRSATLREGRLSSSEAVVVPHPSLPPQQQLYWTSHETRLQEYAAIDAASKGLRGLVVRMLPDCILPKETRRTRFCRRGEVDEDDDRCSVRRYRLCVDDEKIEELTEKKAWWRWARK